MKQALIYSGKVWLTTLTVAPFLAASISFFMAVYNPLISSIGLGFSLNTYFDFYAALLLLPLALLFWLAAFGLLKTQRKVVIIKSALTTVAIIFCILPFMITGRNLQLSLLSLMSTSYWLPSYLVVAVFSIWVYNIQKTKSKSVINLPSTL
jgi:hypothetical protein